MRLINADDLKEHIIQLILLYKGTRLENVIIEAIDNAPTVNVESCRDCPFVEEKDKGITKDSCFENCPLIRPTGEWIMNKTSPKGRNYTCNVCNKISITNFHYCPNCGAKMKGAEE